MNVANLEQLDALRNGLQCWNRWRRDNPEVRVDLSGADLTGVDIGVAQSLRDAEAKGLISQGSNWPFIVNEIIGYDVLPLDLSGADLRNAMFEGSDLRFACCSGADLSGARMQKADLWRADLSFTRLFRADLSNASLRRADLHHSVLVSTNLDGTDIGHAHVYGSSVWDVRGTPKDETALVVTPPGEPELSVDGLAMTQFLYYLIHNENTRNAIDTLTTKVVLILGNFSEERKKVLDAIRQRLRLLDLLPILFDFSVPVSKDVTGTVETLARLSRFVLADLTEPRSIPQELAMTVPHLRTTPFLLLRQAGTSGYSMVKDLMAYPWVLPVYEYDSQATLIEQLSEVIKPACALADKLRQRDG